MTNWIVAPGPYDFGFSEAIVNASTRLSRAQAECAVFKPVEIDGQRGKSMRWVYPARVAHLLGDDANLYSNHWESMFQSSALLGVDRIVVITTDQSNAYNHRARTKMSCPYWQDTFPLKGVYESFFGDTFPHASVEVACVKDEAIPFGDSYWGLIQRLKQALRELPPPEGRVIVSCQTAIAPLQTALTALAAVANQDLLVINDQGYPESLYMGEVLEEFLKRLDG